MPKISVLIPFYNRAAYLREAIDSVLAQTFTDFEIVALDDGSDDGSSDLVTAYSDTRIRLVRNAQNLGIPATRNRGIAEARGEYFAFLDSDDTALPERLARQAEFLDAHPDYAAVGAWIEWIDDQGQRTGRIKRKPTSSEQIRAERLFRSGLENSTVMARTQTLKNYPHREDMVLGSDYDLWARVAADHNLAALPQVLVYRREHAEQATHTKIATTKALRLEIFAWQLAALNIDYSTQDLENHYLLRRMHKEAFTPDRAFLRWTENWLLRLKHANAKHKRYPIPAFSAVLGGFWFKAYWNARANLDRAVVQQFLTSKLRGAGFQTVTTTCSRALKSQLAKLINLISKKRINHP